MTCDSRLLMFNLRLGTFDLLTVTCETCELCAECCVLSAKLLNCGRLHLIPLSSPTTVPSRLYWCWNRNRKVAFGYRFLHQPQSHQGLNGAGTGAEQLHLIPVFANRNPIKALMVLVQGQKRLHLIPVFSPTEVPSWP